MSNETIDMVSQGLWERARTICISMMPTEALRNRAERNFSMIRTVSGKDGKFNIVALNKLTADMLEKDYGEALHKSFILAGSGEDFKLTFSFDENAKPAIIVPQEGKIVEKSKTGRIHTFISTMPLKEYYTFEEFVEGPSNSYVLAAAKGVANSPGRKAMNPLFIHGGTGLGKTHIMQAIGNEVRRRNPAAAVCYLTAEAFLNEYVNAMAHSSLPIFRERYRKIDVLLIDDIQFLADRMRAFQEEFFNTFNALTNADKQIVITSDVAPKDLPGIEERLISRFEGGMLQEIESPGYETRLAILKKKAEGMTPAVNDRTLTFIAQNIKSHVRAMEGALSKVNIFSNRDPKMMLTEETLSYILKDFIEKEKTRKRLTIEEVQNCICKKFGITLAQLNSTERTQSIVTPRQLAMYIARTCTTRNLQEIAKTFDKSHATILHGVKTIKKRLDVEPELRDILDELLDELGCSIKDINE